MSKIQPISRKEKKIYASKEVKNFWLKKNMQIQEESRYETDKTALIEGLINQAIEGTICLQSELLSDNRIVEALYKAAEHNNRVYILANNFHESLKKLCGRCLIRFGIKNIGSFILLNPNSNNSRGFFFTGQLSEGSLNLPSNLFLNLDGEQSGILYRHFCYHFWNTARSEITDASGDHETGNPPIDVYPCTENFCDADYIKDLLKSQTKNCTLITSMLINKDYFDFSHLEKSIIICSLKNNNNELLPLVKNAGNTIYSFENGIVVNIIKSNNEMWIIPKQDINADDIFYALQLNKEQIFDLDRHIEQYTNTFNYEYFGSRKRGDIKGREILPLDSSVSVMIKETDSKHLENIFSPVLVSQAEFVSIKPDDFPDDETAVDVTYTWTTVPFFRPKDSKRHHLYAEWDKETGKINAVLSGILEAIKKSEENKSFKESIAKFFLGKSTKFNSFKGEIAELQDIKYSLIPHNKFEEHITRIKDISKTVHTDINELNEEFRRTKIDNEIKEINGQINEKRRELEKINEQVTEQEKEQASKTPNTPSPDFSKKYSADKQDIEKKIKQLEDKRKEKEKEKASKIPEQPKKTSPLSNIIFKNKLADAKSAETSLEVSNLKPLPSTGSLYQLDNQSYLAITDYDEFEIGQKEAARLNAKLCAEGS
jgi:hypothetical protein